MMMIAQTVFDFSFNRSRFWNFFAPWVVALIGHVAQLREVTEDP